MPENMNALHTEWEGHFSLSSRDTIVSNSLSHSDSCESCYTGCDPELLVVPVSRLLTAVTGLSLTSHLPYVSSNVATHVTCNAVHDVIDNT